MALTKSWGLSIVMLIVIIIVTAMADRATQIRAGWIGPWSGCYSSKWQETNTWDCWKGAVQNHYGLVDWLPVPISAYKPPSKKNSWGQTSLHGQLALSVYREHLSGSSNGPGPGCDEHHVSPGWIGPAHHSGCGEQVLANPSSACVYVHGQTPSSSWHTSSLSSSTS